METSKNNFSNINCRKKQIQFNHYVDQNNNISETFNRSVSEKIVQIDPSFNNTRRTIILKKVGKNCGFTLQSYGFTYDNTETLECISYVDHVEKEGPAFTAGLLEGDVILSINGTSMEQMDHSGLVNFIKSCGTNMRMVVLYEASCQLIKLNIRLIQLEKLRNEKLFELHSLERQENLTIKVKNQQNGHDNDLSENYLADKFHCERKSLESIINGGSQKTALMKNISCSNLLSLPDDIQMGSSRFIEKNKSDSFITRSNCSNLLPTPQIFVTPAENHSPSESLHSSLNIFYDNRSYHSSLQRSKNHIRSKKNSEHFLSYPWFQNRGSNSSSINAVGMSQTPKLNRSFIGVNTTKRKRNLFPRENDEFSNNKSLSSEFSTPVYSSTKSLNCLKLELGSPKTVSTPMSNIFICRSNLDLLKDDCDSNISFQDHFHKGSDNGREGERKSTKSFSGESNTYQLESSSDSKCCETLLHTPLDTVKVSPDLLIQKFNKTNCSFNTLEKELINEKEEVTHL